MKVEHQFETEGLNRVDPTLALVIRFRSEL